MSSTGLYLRGDSGLTLFTTTQSELARSIDSATAVAVGVGELVGVAVADGVIVGDGVAVAVAVGVGVGVSACAEDQPVAETAKAHAEIKAIA